MLHRKNGKEHGNYCYGLGFSLELLGFEDARASEGSCLPRDLEGFSVKTAFQVDGVKAEGLLESFCRLTFWGLSEHGRFAACLHPSVFDKG